MQVVASIMFNQSVYIAKVDSKSIESDFFDCLKQSDNLILKNMSISRWTELLKIQGKNEVKKSITFLFRTKRGLLSAAVINAFSLTYQGITRSESQNMEWTAHENYVSFQHSCVNSFFRHLNPHSLTQTVPIHIQAYCDAVVVNYLFSFFDLF